MPVEPTDFTVFYSWQSDLPDETNRQAIRSALRIASNKIEAAAPKYRIVLDEATRGEPGSPNIPATILDKIKSCEVFVCDITTINSTAIPTLRRTPNPNVLFELGYAVAHLGWQRIIMLFNDEFGEVSDAPFDIDRHRISRYKLSPTDAKNKDKHARLADALSQGVISVAEKNPVRPLDGEQLSPEQIKRKRDISNLRWILGTIHFPTLDQMASDLPSILHYKATYFWEGFNAVVENSLFHLYDTEALDAIKLIHKSWKTCVSNGEQYHMTVNSNTYVFKNPGDAPLSKNQQRVWDAINNARTILQLSQTKLLTILRDRYLEIDVDEMNAAAWREYIEFQRDIEQQYEEES